MNKKLHITRPTPATRSDYRIDGAIRAELRMVTGIQDLKAICSGLNISVDDLIRLAETYRFTAPRR